MASVLIRLNFPAEAEYLLANFRSNVVPFHLIKVKGFKRSASLLLNLRANEMSVFPHHLLIRLLSEGDLQHRKLQ